MNYYLVTYDMDDVEQIYEIVYCRSKKEAKKIVAKVLGCESKFLNAELKQLHSIESINRVNVIREKLEKYSFPPKIIKKLLNQPTLPISIVSAFFSAPRAALRITARPSSEDWRNKVNNSASSAVYSGRFSDGLVMSA